MDSIKHSELIRKYISAMKRDTERYRGRNSRGDTEGYEDGDSGSYHKGDSGSSQTHPGYSRGYDSDDTESYHEGDTEGSETHPGDDSMSDEEGPPDNRRLITGSNWVPRSRPGDSWYDEYMSSQSGQGPDHSAVRSWYHSNRSK